MARNGEDVFGIALVMAGAVSAGAYTAGVVDFLFEALDAWERRKRSGADTPHHRVELRVLTGASAGAVTAAVLASALRDRGYPDPEAKTPSPLHRTWVELIDLGGLLGDGDLKARPEIRSLLNASCLDEIATEVMGRQPSTRSAQDWPAYVANPLQLYLTVTNLRGVPYSIYFQGETGSAYGMSLHADYMHFSLSPTGQTVSTAIPLGLADGLTGPWAELKDSALASAAFPVGLAARTLTRTGTLAYDSRLWPIPTAGPAKPEEPCVCQEEKTIAPAWPSPWPAQQPRGRWHYQFVNVDGGVANNEPFELARRCLAGQDGRNPRDAKEANRAVVMVDPFPSEAAVEFDYRAEEREGLFAVLPALLGAVTAQMRFKTEELELARSPEVFSRFIIAPTRWENAGGVQRRARFALAGGGLGGFAGFLAQPYRQHDYQLGRRNCQQFLRQHFLLDERNPLFRSWPEALRARFRSAGEGRSYLPIIPLFGTCAEDIPEPPWPQGKLGDIEVLRKRITARAEALVRAFTDTRVSSGWDRFLLKTGWRIMQWRKRLFGQDMVDPLIEAIQNDLRKRELL